MSVILAQSAVNIEEYNNMVTNWAVVIGVRPEQGDLKYSTKDAKEIYDLWEDKFSKLKENGLIKDYKISHFNSNPNYNPKYPNLQPTHDKIVGYFDNLGTQNIGEKDNFWLFFSGHGVRHNSEDYLILANSNLQSINTLEQTSITTTKIINRLTELTKGNILLFLDACRKDLCTGEKGIGKATLNVAEGKNVITFFSCQENESSWEISEEEKSSFTSALLKGLADEDKYSNLEKLESYVKQEVTELNQKHNKPQQTPYLSLSSETLKKAKIKKANISLYLLDNMALFGYTKPIHKQIIEKIFLNEYCCLLIHPISEKDQLIENIKNHNKNKLKQNHLAITPLENFYLETIFLVITPNDINPKNKTNFSTPNSCGQWYFNVLKAIKRKIKEEKLMGLDDLDNLWKINKNQEPNLKFFNYIETELFNNADIKKNIVIIFDAYQTYPESQSSPSEYWRTFENLNFKYEVWQIIQKFYENRQDNPDYNRLNFIIIDTPLSKISENKQKSITVGWSINWGISQTTHPQLIIDREQLDNYFNTGDSSIVLEQILGWTGLDPFLFQEFCQYFISINPVIAKDHEEKRVNDIINNLIKENSAIIT